MSDLTVVARLLAKIDKDGPLPKWAPFLGPCWIWAGKPKAEGYGTFTVERRPEYAHRASYVIHRGPIPDGLVIDHLCRVRICVNPAHLEPITRHENFVRGIRAIHPEHGTHCAQGHEWNDENTYWNPARTQRHCRVCSRERRSSTAARHNLDYGNEQR